MLFTRTSCHETEAEHLAEAVLDALDIRHVQLPAGQVRGISLQARLQDGPQQQQRGR